MSDDELEPMSDAEIATLAGRLLETAALDYAGPYELPPTVLGEDLARLLGTVLSAWAALARLRPDDCAAVAATLRLIAMGQDLDGAASRPNG